MGLAAATYCVLAYNFMWPPVVTNYWFWHQNTDPTNPCINNMRHLEAAINQWAQENGKHSGDPVTLEQLKPYLSNREIPTCHFGGKYSVTVVSADPTCSIGWTNTDMKIRRGMFFYERVGPSHIMP